jgi:transposase
MHKSFHELIDTELKKYTNTNSALTLANFLQSKNVPRATAFRIQSAKDKEKAFTKAQIGYLERAFYAKKLNGRLIIPDYAQYSIDHIESFLTTECVSQKSRRCSTCDNPLTKGLKREDPGNRRVFRFCPTNHVQKKPSPFAQGKVEPCTKREDVKISDSMGCCNFCVKPTIEVLNMDYSEIISYLLEMKYTQLGLARSLRVKQSYISKLKNSDFDAISPYFPPESATRVHLWAIRLKLTEVEGYFNHHPEQYLHSFLLELSIKGYTEKNIIWHPWLLSCRRKAPRESGISFNSNILIQGKKHTISCYFAQHQRDFLSYIDDTRKNGSRYACVVYKKGTDWSYICIDLEMWPLRFCTIPENNDSDEISFNFTSTLDWKNFLRLDDIEKLHILKNYDNTDEVDAIKAFLDLNEFEQCFEQCIELINVHGFSVRRAAKEMNVHLPSRRVSQYITAEQKRIQELEKQVKLLESDNTLLKKTSELFTIEMNNGSKSS